MISGDLGSSPAQRRPRAAAGRRARPRRRLGCGEAEDPFKRVLSRCVSLSRGLGCAVEVIAPEGRTARQRGEHRHRGHRRVWVRLVRLEAAEHGVHVAEASLHLFAREGELWWRRRGKATRGKGEPACGLGGCTFWFCALIAARLSAGSASISRCRCLGERAARRENSVASQSSAMCGSTRSLLR